MKEIIENSLKESINLKQQIIDELLPDIEKVAKIIIKAIKNNKKILLFGNGGSAADAQHIAAELVNKFKKERRGIPAIALTTDTSILTSLANDYNFDYVFVRQIEALSNEGDVAIGISTSGKSKNVIEAIKYAKKNNLKTIALCGRGGILKNYADLAICVPSDNTPRIQEAHITIGHILCELIEDSITSSKG